MASRWPVAHPRNQAHRRPERPSALSVLPVELWMKIFSIMPLSTQLACLMVSRGFYQLCSQFTFQILRLHLDTTYFDRSGSRHMNASQHARPINTTGKAEMMLRGICAGVVWANLVDSVVIFVRDSSNPMYFQVLSAALKRLPRIRHFHVVVTNWRHGEAVKRVDDRPIGLFVRDILKTMSNLEVLTLPPLFVDDMVDALINIRSLRKVYLHEELDSPSATLPKRFTDELLARHANPRYSIGTAGVLQELCIPEEIISVVPRDILHSLKKLEVLNVCRAPGLCEMLQACHNLRSLMVHELIGYSTALTHTGLQLAAGEEDWPINPVNVKAHKIFTILAARPELMPKLNAFKYVQYHSILPVAICHMLEAFLSKRLRLEKLDINAVITDIGVARRILQLTKKMRHLSVLGIEYRDPRNAFAGVPSVLSEIPNSVKHLRFAVHGWSFFSYSRTERISTMDSVLAQALRALPQLTFLHVSDGVERPMEEDADMTSLSTSQLGKMKTLCLENSWYDVAHTERRLVPWCPREVYWNAYFDRMSPDAQWLMRYHRDVRGPF